MMFAVSGPMSTGVSGAPLIVEDGTVGGMMVAMAKDDPDRGYALTAEEILPVANEATNATRHVSTRKCRRDRCVVPLQVSVLVAGFAREQWPWWSSPSSPGGGGVTGSW
jgi:hypothetical protein